MNTQAIAILDECEGEKCIVKETLLRDKKTGDCELLRDFNGECVNNNMNCRYRAAGQCRCDERTIRSIYESLVEKMFSKELGKKPMHTNGNHIELTEVSEETRRYYESLVGHTPFSFFKNLSSNIQIFDYYENYATELIKGFCEAINQEFKTTYEYMVNPTINAGCMLEGDINRIIVYEWVVFSLYDYAHKLLAYYKTIQINPKRIL